MGIYKACDIRGHYGTDLTDDIATRLGFAIAEYYGQIDILVGGDGRLSTPALKEHVIDALHQAGCHVVDLGIVPTPALYFARKHLGIDAAVMVTASHNPAGDNGFKITLGPRPIRPEDIIALEQIMERPQARQPPQPGTLSRVLDWEALRTSHTILNDYIQFVSDQAARYTGVRIVVDCANGVPALVARAIWQRTGADVSYLFDNVDGHFPNHAPDPSSVSNLAALRQEVVQTHSDLGVAYDGDGDRVIFVDSLGRPLSGDRAIILFASKALQAGPAPIVYDQKCSLVVADTIRALGGEPIMERSGHTFIKTTFLQRNAPYAGEISGHHFFREFGYDDGIISSLYLVNLLVSQSRKLAELADAIHTYAITPDIRLKMDETTARRVLDDLSRELENEARLIRLDGLRAEFADGWGIMRQSVTEAAITLRFEGKNTASLRQIIRRFEEAAPDLAGRLPVPDET